MGAKISTVSALPHPLPPPTRRAAAPPSPGLWDRERAEGLALHTNVLPIVKAPLCPGAPLRRLRGGHNGGSVPEFPQTVTCFQSLPPPPPPPTPVSGGPSECGGMSPRPGGWAGGDPPPPPFPGQAGEMGTRQGVAPAPSGAGPGRAVSGRTWNSGSMRPAQGTGHAACPLLGSTCPGTAAGGCPPFLPLPPRGSYMQRHTGARPCMRPHTRSGPHI